jgi:hypothetical protein
MEEISLIRKTIIEKCEDESFRSILLGLSESYGVIVPVILADIANYENNINLYVDCAWLWSLYFGFLDGANDCSLYMFRRALELDPENIIVLESLLDFYGAPDNLIDLEDALKYATKIESLDPNNIRLKRFKMSIGKI